MLACPREPRDSCTAPVPFPRTQAGSVTHINQRNVAKMMLCWFQANGLGRPGCFAFALLGALSHHARPAVLERPSGELVDSGQQDSGTRKTARLTDPNAAMRVTIKTARRRPAYDSKTVSREKRCLKSLSFKLVTKQSSKQCSPGSCFCTMGSKPREKEA